MLNCDDQSTVAVEKISQKEKNKLRKLNKKRKENEEVERLRKLVGDLEKKVEQRDTKVELLQDQLRKGKQDKKLLEN